MSNSPDARRVILVPIETTLYSNENSHTEKQPLFLKRPYTWNLIRATFSGPRVSKILKFGSQGSPGYDIDFTQFIN